MRTQQELLEYLASLESHDVSVAVALCELFRRADENGRADRGEWLASVRDAYETLDIPHTDHFEPGGFGKTEVLGQYLEEQVIARLEASEVARRAPLDEDWEELVVAAPLWEAVHDERETIDEVLDATIHRLQDEKRRRMRERVFEPPEGGSRLYAEGLTKIYRKRKVVNDVDISVTQGEIVGLLGPNGAGKTTSFYMIVGLIPPNEGKVYLDGDDLTSVPMYQRARMGVGYLSQEPSIFRKLTVEENVLAILETLDLPRKERKVRLEELLKELSIDHLRESKAYSLSGGERRRLEITRALVQRPKFLLLDEPFAGIDPIAVNDIQQIVSGLKHRGIGVIISDHNVEQTLEIVDRAYIMYEGRIRVSGTVSELVWSEEVAEIYLGPTLTQRMRQRFERPEGAMA